VISFLSDYVPDAMLIDEDEKNYIQPKVII
jgi:hypothetical protein